MFESGNTMILSREAGEIGLVLCCCRCDSYTKISFSHTDIPKGKDRLRYVRNFLFWQSLLHQAGLSASHHRNAPTNCLNIRATKVDLLCEVQHKHVISTN